MECDKLRDFLNNSPKELIEKLINKLETSGDPELKIYADYLKLLFQ